MNRIKDRILFLTRKYMLTRSLREPPFDVEGFAEEMASFMYVDLEKLFYEICVDFLKRKNKSKDSTSV